MTTIRVSLHNPWWSQMYERYTNGDPSNKHYGHFALSQTYQPLTIDSNNQYTIELDRRCGSLCSYNIGGVSPFVRRNNTFRKIDQCSDETGAPHMCARAYIGKRSVTESSGGGAPLAGGEGTQIDRGYDRLG